MREIKYFIMDVDGTLTDGKVYEGPEGEVFKIFSIKDGYGITDILEPAGVAPVILLAHDSDIVSHRCQKLGITEVRQGIHDKESELQAVTDDLSQVAYIGDDLNDLPCMKLVKEAGGLTGCPKNAAEQVT